jgi:hypothetical protein
MTEAAVTKPKVAAQGSAPWRGRRKVADPKSKAHPIRFTPGQLEELNAKARTAGMSVGALVRTVVLGSPGPRAVRRPPIEKAELARLLGELGKVGSNVNQLARAYNQAETTPSFEVLSHIKGEIVAIRTAIMQALGREP